MSLNLYFNLKIKWSACFMKSRSHANTRVADADDIYRILTTSVTIMGVAQVKKTEKRHKNIKSNMIQLFVCLFVLLRVQFE